MKLVIAAISAGGVVGAADQYLCLLVVSILAKTGLIELSPDMAILFESWWFIGIVAAFWLITLAPSYATFIGPGVMNVVNTVVKLLSGLLVPVSAALLALASAGVITGMHPELSHSLQAMQLFDLNGDGSIGDGLFVITGSALMASTLTGAKFLAKPAFSTATGTTGTVSAPLYATLENAASVVLMVLLVVFLKIDPWLWVGLFAIVAVLVLGALIYAVYRLWKLAKGVGRVIHMIETRPRAGLSVVAEFLVWGSGSLIWEMWPRGVLRIVLWALWLLTILFVIPGLATVAAGAFVIFPILEALVPVFFVMAEALVVVVGLYVGLRSASSLMEILDQPKAAAGIAPAQQPSVP